MSERKRLSAAQAARLMRLGTYASVGVALALVAAKLVAWQLSGSVSLLASLVDSGLDALASLVNLLAVRKALHPPDREHRFGHGKVEALAGLGQALLICGSSTYLLYSAGMRLRAPEPLADLPVALWVIVFSLAATIALVLFQRHVIAHTASLAIRADSLHYRSDLLLNLGVLLALGLTQAGWLLADPLIAAAIALYILYSAWHILRDALDHLMDRELSQSERDHLRQIALAHPDVLGMHDLRTRRSGTTAFVQMHLVLADDLTLQSAHRIADEVEAQLLATLPDAEVLIHTDPRSVVGVEQRQEFH